MDLTHTFSVPTDVETTWAHFEDIAGLAGCFPGAQVTSVEGETFAGSVKVKLGPIALTYSGSGTFTEKDDAAHRFVVEAKGKDKRGNGTAGATVRLSMQPGTGADDGGTAVEVLTDLAITGKPAQFGRGVMQDVSDKLLGQFVACLEQKLSAGSPNIPDTAPSPDPAAAAEPTPIGDSASRAAETAAAPPASAPSAAGSTTDSAAGSAAGSMAGSTTSSKAASNGAATTPPPASNEALDLGAAVLPVLLRTYAKPATAVLAAVLAVVWLRRRRG